MRMGIQNAARPVILAVLALVSVQSPGAEVGPATPQQPATYSLSTNAVDWLVKSVCADASDRPISADPYYVCPKGTRLRKTQRGEMPPYNNVNQTGNLWSDSFILSDAQGRPLYFRSFDWGPTFGTWANNVDGYDTYSLSGGWVSINATKSGDSGGQAWFTDNCSRDATWVLFPLRDFLKDGTAHTRIGSRNWEQMGASYPGPCPVTYYPLETDWHLQRSFAFGGKDAPKKTMDTLIAYHDFQTTPDYLKSGHMEVYYFTQQYGLARWEAWAPIQQGAKPTPKCDVPPTVTYKRQVFVVQDCQDFAKVTPGRPTDDEAWPLPQANVLADGHLSSVSPLGGGASWLVWGPNEAKPIWVATNSKAPGDSKYDPTGVRLVALDCRTQAGCASLSQDVPTDRVPTGLYLYGASVRTSDGTTGDFRVGLQALGPRDAILWQDSFVQTIHPYNGSHPGNVAEEASVYQSVAFPHKIIRVPHVQGATTYRVVLTAAGNARYEITEGWLNRWPDSSTGPIGAKGK
jgi:hypothetical protein